MDTHKKLAGFFMTLAELDRFIAHCRAEGFDDSTILNPTDRNSDRPGGIHVFVDRSLDPMTEMAVTTHEGKCKECRQIVPADSMGIAQTHYRGDTQHPGAECFGVGRTVTQLTLRETQQ